MNRSARRSKVGVPTVSLPRSRDREWEVFSFLPTLGDGGQRTRAQSVPPAGQMNAAAFFARPRHFFIVMATPIEENAANESRRSYRQDGSKALRAVRPQGTMANEKPAQC